MQEEITTSIIIAIAVGVVARYIALLFYILKTKN